MEDYTNSIWSRAAKVSLNQNSTSTLAFSITEFLDIFTYKNPCSNHSTYNVWHHRVGHPTLKLYLKCLPLAIYHFHLPNYQKQFAMHVNRANLSNFHFQIHLLCTQSHLNLLFQIGGDHHQLLLTMVFDIMLLLLMLSHVLHGFTFLRTNLIYCPLSFISKTKQSFNYKPSLLTFSLTKVVNFKP